MSLANITVFNKWVYTTLSELVAQQINLFNEATRGALILRNDSNVGDFSDSTFWKIMGNIVRRRDAYGSGAVTAIDLQMLVDTMVKVAGGTPPINIPPVMWTWIGKNPEEAGAEIAKQLAPAMMQDMLNTAVSALSGAMRNVAAINYDASGGTAGAELFNPANVNVARSKLGDRSAAVVCWVAHSKPMHDYFANAIANAAQLYTYETIAVVRDPFGAVFVISDIPSLVVTGTPDDYISLGLVPGAAMIMRNDDFLQNTETKNGDENILRTYQAEWSYNLGIKGFSWDKTNGGKSPSNSALATGTNWDQTATSIKDLPGVVLRTQ